ncbi:putative orphan protein [Pseudoalteromonas translucida]|uniref:Orphan protein n=1 Tax=Pseudoalteromonas translucida (strain TAC 125) TaxID=326442 RepID=Q3IKS4_PSET1|nr:putative orphan protein [Pseudoalteromonas translucida]
MLFIFHKAKRILAAIRTKHLLL